MSGAQRLGFEWIKSSQDYNKVNNEGYIEIYFNVYSKQSLHLQPQFKIDRLVDNSMNWKMDEFYIQAQTAFKYNIWMNMLCLDVSFQTQAYEILIDMSTRFVECYKTVVDCFFDFGQFAKADTITSEKPFSPYAKLLDKCTLSTQQTVTVKNYKPLTNDPTATQFLVGSGNYDEACFPGNVLIYLIDYDHLIALAAKAAPGPQVMSIEDQETDFWKKTVLISYIKPLYEKAILGGMSMLVEFAQQFEPNHKDGTHTLSEVKMEDYFPLKGQQ